MKFHSKKCKVLHVGRTNKKEDNFMHSSNGNLHRLEETEVEKDLGVFTDHCQNKINRANNVLRYIRHTFQYIHSYSSLVHSHVCLMYLEP